MAWASVSLYLCGLCASRKKWWCDIAIILTIAIVATTMVMMVMVVLPITSIDQLTNQRRSIDQSMSQATKIDRLIDVISIPPPTSLSPAGRSYRYQTICHAPYSGKRHAQNEIGLVALPIDNQPMA